MVDRYIDYAETQQYGIACVAALRKRSKEDEAFGRIAARVESSTNGVGELLDRARETRRTRSGGIEAKLHVFPEAKELLAATWHWAKAHREVDVKRFFPEGKWGASKSSAGDLLVAVETCVEAFGHHGKLPEAKSRRAALAAVARRLKACLGTSSDASTELVEITPELVQAREEWLQTWSAAKLAVEGLLRLDRPGTDVSGLMKRIFPDLAVPDAPGKAKPPVSTEPAASAPSPQDGASV